jgi:putative membrane-bound dehydrogenase-like protein
VPVDVDISGAKKIWLIVTDGGDHYNCDWADWIEPKLIRADGSAVFLTNFSPKVSSTGWGKVNIGKNASGGPLKLENRTYSNGIGVHAPSLLEYDLPENFARFQAKIGPDMGGVNQGCGTSVEFLIFTEPPSANVFQLSNVSAERKFGLESAREDIQQMTVAGGLEVSLFAAEPMLRNPANIDVDERGRVWVAEAVNYRSSFKPWGILDPNGDRIVILEDTDGDGLADHSKIFYQDKSLQAPLGICVLGKKVIVSDSPEIFILTDTDGDDKADKKEVLFQVGGFDDDHGVHAVSFGPDVKLYFNFGNHGEFLKDKNGNPVRDVNGNEIVNNGAPFRQGMAFRCNLDGSDVEVIGHNFRNPYEVCVDSFGTVWQSDNDDDGNRSVRINYVMQHGNFGYTDEKSGASWREKRTNMESETPARHWHQNDPGVVPNLLVTGAGAPAGIAIYEGKLLPEIFRNQLIHCDPGPRVVRSYPIITNGAGFSAKIVDLVSSSDSWFRPSDVCVAPDGSLLVADWNDATVGGHNMADRDAATMRGRIYRIAPKGQKFSVPHHDFTLIEGSVAALQSPNSATRYMAWEELRALGGIAEKELLKLWNGNEPRMRARALQLLARIDGKTQKYVDLAVSDNDAEIRVTGLRIAKDLKLDLIPILQKLASDKSPQVRRECALVLHGNSSPNAAKIWAQLALQHDGKDRWYLEALGIGAAKNENACFEAWLNLAGENWNSAAGRDIIWRSRSPKVAAYLARIIADPNTPEAERARYFRSFDFLEGAEKEAALIQLLGFALP